MAVKKSREMKLNSIKYIFTVVLVLSALLSSFIPVFAEWITKPSVTKPSVGSAPNTSEDKYTEDDVGFLESLFEEKETDITEKDNIDDSYNVVSEASPIISKMFIIPLFSALIGITITTVKRILLG